MATSKQTYRIYVKSGPCFALTIKDEKLILAPFNPKNESQFWFKETGNTEVVDAEGIPSFALVNKATNQAIKRSAQNQVQSLQLVPYNSNVVDLSLFWSEAPDSNDGYKAIRTVMNFDLCFDAEKAELNVEDGTPVGLWTRNNQNNQWWKIEEYEFVPPRRPTYKITNLVNPNFALTIRGGKVLLANPNANDNFQHWYKYEGQERPPYGAQFTLVNKATGQAIQRPTQLNRSPVRLLPFSTNLITESTILWNTNNERRGNGVIRCLDGSGHHWYPQAGQVKDGQEIQTKLWDNADNMCWKITPY